uniref:Uncharacterized protein n=1 Tax=Triatoma infestans TaxID=30076 RepID=A0A161M4R3_TRIIF
MHRLAGPKCSCSTQLTVLPVKGIRHGCLVQETAVEPELDLRWRTGPAEPIIYKPTTIRTNRGHRSWMTHLPLSRPREIPITAI